MAGWRHFWGVIQDCGSNESCGSQSILMNSVGSFKRILHAGAMVSFGTLSSVLLNFVAGIIIIRLVTRSEFGLISLGSTLINVVVVVAVLGFKVGLPRLLSKYRAQDSKEIVASLIRSALSISLFSGALISLLLYFSAPSLSMSFGKPGLQQVIQAFALMVLPLVLMDALTGIFRGFENARAKVIFQDVSLNLVRIMLIVFVWGISFSFQNILLAYVVSAWIAFSIYVYYAAPRLVPKCRSTFRIMAGKELMLFSVPLMAVGMMGNMMAWASTLILGFLQPPGEVGLFNAPLRLANVIPIPLGAMLFLYLPLATKLFERHALSDLKKLYVTITKWAYLATLPLLLFFLLDAEFIVVSLFGSEYQDAANILRVLALGFSVHTFLGPNATTLISRGNTRAVLHGTGIAALFTVLLCLALVPHYGAFGAAVGTAVAKSISNVYISIALYLRVGVHPFSAQYIKPVIFSITSSLAFYALLNVTGIAHPVAHLLLFLVMVLLALVSPLVTRSMDPADVEIIGSLERRLWKKNIIVSWLEKTCMQAGGGAAEAGKQAPGLDQNSERHK